MFSVRMAAGLMWCCFALGVAAAADAPAPPPAQTALSDTGCLACHDGHKGELSIAGPNGKPRALKAVDKDKLAKSVHAKLQCVECHTDIIDNASPHKRGPAPRADCATCH